MLRHATIEETQFYNTQLYPLMDSVMQIIQSDKFYLTGGTCLARHYFHHRYSDDLDFFFLGEKYSREEYEQEFRVLASQIPFEKKVTVNSEYFKRILVTKDNCTLKLEFIYEPMQHIAELVKVANYWIDNKQNVAANKITALYGRKTYKDYFDLFYLLREIDLQTALQGAELKMVPLDYEGALMVLKDGELQERVLTIEPTNEQEFHQFVKDLQHKLLIYAKNT